MTRDIVLWPDPVLTRNCERVRDIDDAIHELADDMLETMYAASGRGLAAPQVGVPLRLFVMDCGWKNGVPRPVVMVNPKLQRQSDKRVTGPESCLSIPGITADVERAAEVRMRWTDLNGRTMVEALFGFDAICAQHELDHLNGTVIFDRLDPETRASHEAAYNP